MQKLNDANELPVAVASMIRATAMLALSYGSGNDIEKKEAALRAIYTLCDAEPSAVAPAAPPEPPVITGEMNEALIDLWGAVALASGKPLNVVVPLLRPHTDALIAAVRAERVASPETLGTRVVEWQQAALIAGEHLASTGPTGYYDFTPEQWVTWVRDGVAANTLHTLNANLTAARIEFAAAVRDATGSERFRPDHSAIDKFAVAVLRAQSASPEPEQATGLTDWPHHCNQCGGFGGHESGCIGHQPSEQATGWQPIKTAPKDGSEFLAVCVHGMFGPPTLTREIAWWEPAPKGYTYGGRFATRSGNIPTSWHALPARPEPAKQPAKPAPPAPRSRRQARSNTKNEDQN